MYHGNRHRIAGGFLGNLGRGLLNIGKGVVGGFLAKGPVGAIIGAAGAIPHAVSANVRATTLQAGDNPAADRARVAAIHAAHAHMANTRAIGGGGAPVMLSPGAVGAAMGGGGGGRRRRMHWANTRALARAERRIHAAVKHMTKYIRWVHPKKDGHAAPKFKGRKR